MADMYNICFYGGLVLAILLLITTVVLFVVLKIPRVIGELTGRTAKKGIEKLKGSTGASSDVSKKEQAKYYNQNSGKMKIREAVVSAETRKRNHDDTTDLLENGNKKAGKRITDNLKKKGLDDKVTDVLGDKNKKPDTAGEEQQEDKTQDIDNEKATDVLNNDNAKDVSEEVTDLLTDDEATDVLAEDEATDVLTDEEATDVLAEDEATDILAGEEATDVLREGRMPTEEEDETSVLVNDTVVDKLSAKAKVKYNVIVVNTEEHL